MTQYRDPSQDPHPGDVIYDICIGVGRPCSYYVRHVEDGRVYFDFGYEPRQEASLEEWRRWTAGRRAKLRPEISGQERFIKVIEGLLWELEQIDDAELTTFERNAKERFRSLLGRSE